MRQQVSRLLAVLTFAAIATSIHTASAVDVFTTPVGFYKIPIGAGPGKLTSVGLPLQLLKADQGLVTSVSSSSIGVAGTCASCVSSNYGNPNALHYVEFLTGAGLGRYFAVQTNTATSITLAVGAESLTALGSGGAVAVGNRYVLHPFMKLRDVFGPASACALQAGTKASTSDNVLIWNGVGFLTAFPSSGAGVWNVNGALNDNFPILPDEALFVLRRGATGTNGIVIGDVRTTNTFSVLQGGGSLNYVCNSFPAGMTLDNSGLTNALTGFHGGTKAGTSDNVLIWDPVAQGFKTAFYSTGANQWNYNGALTNGFLLTAESGYFILNRTTGGYWNKSLPYNP